MKAYPPVLLATAFLLTPVHAQLELVWNLDVPLSSASGAALGDIDGDGDIDALFNNYAADSVLLLNDGSGNYTKAAVQPGIGSGGQSAFGDVDGDGDLDLVTADYFDPCKVFLNDGFGAFTDSGQAVGQSAIRNEVLLVDLNGDSDLDLVLPSDDNSKPNEVWFNNGTGVFSDSGQNLGNAFTLVVVAGDVDGDLDPDLIFGNNGLNTLWLNNGSGTFSPGPALPLSATTFGLGLANLDGDTDLDLFVANGSIGGGQSNHVLINDGAGNFTSLAQPGFTSGYHTAVVLVNLDGDGDLDALVGHNRGQSNEIWINNGSGVFSLSPHPAGPGGSFNIARGNIDGLPGEDFFLSTDATPPRVMFRQPGPGAPLAEGPPLTGSSAGCAAFADLNGDTFPDIALGNIAGTITLLENDGAGNFTDPGTILPNPVGNNIGAIRVGDVDGVNGPDLVVFATQYSGDSDGRDRIWLNDGSGGFTESPQVLDSFGGGTLELADLDGDTDLDIVTVNQGGQNSVFINNGSGSFTRSDALGADSQQTIVLFHADGDSDLDAYVGGTGEPDKLWLNNGSGGFTDSGQSLGTGSPTALVAADFNGDTHIDVFCANTSTGNRLWLNNGSGVFTDSGVNIAPTFASSAAAFDFDGDTDLDLWIGYGGLGPSPDRIMINNGSGTFSFGPSTYGNIATSAALVHDFTGDASADVFLASSQGTHQLWAADESPVSLWASGFSLSGDDILPMSDPDDDDLPNFLEMAYNLNPAVADAQPLAPGGTSGTPFLEYDRDLERFRIVTIQRKNAPFLNYQPEGSPNLINFFVPNNVTVSPFSLGTDYERVTYTFQAPPMLLRAFGRLRVDYTP